MKDITIFPMKEPESFEIPEEIKKLVLERFENARKNLESLVDWEEAKKILNVNEEIEIWKI